MSPTLEAGDRVLVVRHWLSRWLRKGQIVMISEPKTQELFIKRVVALAGETYVCANPSDLEKRRWVIPSKHFFVCGDNPIASTDSRQWGPLSGSSLRGRAILLIRRHMLQDWNNVLISQLSKQRAKGNLLVGPSHVTLVGQLAPAFTARTLDNVRVMLPADSATTLICFDPTKPDIEMFLEKLESTRPQSGKIVNLWILSLGEVVQLRNLQAHTRIPLLTLDGDVDQFRNAYDLEELPCWYGIDENRRVCAMGQSISFEKSPAILWGGWANLRDFHATKA